jgi:hypothetical protein
VKSTYAACSVAGALVVSAAVMFACSNSDTSEPALLPNGAGGTSGAGGGGSPGTTGTGETDGGISGGLVVDASVASLAILPFSVVGMFQLPGDKLFTTGADGVIRTVDSAGTVATVGPVLAGATQITADSVNIYVVTSTGATATNGSIVAIDRSTGIQATLATSLLAPTAIVTDGTYVYWLDGGTGTGVRVASTPITFTGTGAAPTTLASYPTFGTAGNLVITGGVAYFTVNSSETQLFTANISTGALNNQATLVGTQTGTPTGLAVDANDAFITSGGTAGALYELSRADAGAATVTATSLVTAQSGPIGLTFIGTQLVWLDATPGTLQAYDTLSGLSGQITSGFPNATATAIGDAFYVAYNGGVISKVTF